MLLEHPALTKFEPVLRKIADMALGNGVDAVRATGRRDMPDPLKAPSAYRRFLRAVHYGFSQAQSDTVKLLIALELQARELRKGRAADRTLQKETLRVVEARQRALRRLMDAILFQVLYPEHRASRYFAAQKGMQAVDPVVLRRTADVAHRRNADDRMIFHLVSDATTVAQVGDLVRVDRTGLGAGKWSVIELKEGRMNEILNERIQAAGGALSEEEVSDVAEKHGVKAAKQAKRMARQNARADNFRSIIDKDEGLFPLLDVPVVVEAQRHYYEDYFLALHDAVERAKDAGRGSSVVDGCLRIMAVRNEPDRTYGTTRWAVAHALHHALNGAKDCDLDDPARRAAEIAAVNSMDEAVVNLLSHNLNYLGSSSLFLIGNPELVFDLLFERVQVFLYLDFAKLFALAAKHGVRLEWSTERPTDQSGDLRVRFPGTDAYGVRVIDEQGQLDRSMLLLGFFGRIYGEFMPPRDLIKVLAARPIRPRTTSA